MIFSIMKIYSYKKNKKKGNGATEEGIHTYTFFI